MGGSDRPSGCDAQMMAEDWLSGGGTVKMRGQCRLRSRYVSGLCGHSRTSRRFAQRQRSNFSSPFFDAAPHRGMRRGVEPTRSHSCSCCRVVWRTTDGIERLNLLTFPRPLHLTAVAMTLDSFAKAMVKLRFAL